MSVNANVIRLSDNRQKIQFIDWDGANPTDYSQINYNSQNHTVVSYGGTNSGWLIINAPKGFTTKGRIVIGGSD